VTDRRLIGTPAREALPASSPGAWRTALLRADATIQDAILNLDESAVQIALIVTCDDRLVGTVTDGDIRRGLLRGLSLAGSVREIVNNDPLVVPPELERATVLQLMQANKIRQLPVVAEDRRVLGLHLWDELITPCLRPNLMVIMAGGQGRRLLPQTRHCPKSMLPVAGKPMLEHIIERAKADGFRQFVVAIHYLGHLIEKHFRDGSRWQVSIEYLRETAPLGTAGAIALLSPRPDAPILVSNGDVLTNIHYGDMLEFHCQHGAAATMAVRVHEWQHPFGVVRTQGVDIVGFEEKPVSRSHVNAGIYVLDPSALNTVNVGEPCDMPTVFSRLREGGARTIAYPMYEPWLDIGEPDTLEWAQSHWRAA
jgi:dTDP-glucose pyrophosphorylase